MSIVRFSLALSSAASLTSVCAAGVCAAGVCAAGVCAAGVRAAYGVCRRKRSNMPWYGMTSLGATVTSKVAVR